MYGIGAHERDKVWNIGFQWEAETAAAKHHGRDGATTLSPTAGSVPALPLDRITKSKRPQTEFMARRMVQTISTSTTPSPLSSSDIMLERAVQEAETFEDLAILAVFTTNESSLEIDLGPLKW